MVAAWMRKAMAARGSQAVAHVFATGSTASWPTSGSRMMLEKKPDAALLGLPGRTQMVGRRMPMPSKKPRREIVGERAARRSPSGCRSWSAAR